MKLHEQSGNIVTRPHEDIFMKLFWLKVSVEPWQKVEKYFCQTYSHGCTMEAADEFTWPCINHQLGYTLVS